MKLMSMKEFFRFIPKTGWKLTRGGEMRRKIKKRQATFCPITAVAYRKLGEFHRTDGYENAATNLGLSKTFANDVATAADVPGFGPLRTKLLKIARLTEIKETD